jgi:hypothetical protein
MDKECSHGNTWSKAKNRSVWDELEDDIEAEAHHKRHDEIDACGEWNRHRWTHRVDLAALKAGRVRVGNANTDDLEKIKLNKILDKDLLSEQDFHMTGSSHGCMQEYDA